MQQMPLRKTVLEHMPTSIKSCRSDDDDPGGSWRPVPLSFENASFSANKGGCACFAPTANLVCILRVARQMSWHRWSGGDDVRSPNRLERRATMIDLSAGLRVHPSLGSSGASKAQSGLGQLATATPHGANAWASPQRGCRRCVIAGEDWGSRPWILGDRRLHHPNIGPDISSLSSDR